MPAVINKVFKMLEHRDSSFGDIESVIKHDQAISSKVISIANSALYRRAVKIASLKRAMMTIGTEEIKNIVVCLVFLDGVLKKLKLKESDVFDLWSHSLEIAYGSAVLARQEDMERVFTIALLHDLGKLIFYMKCPDYETRPTAGNGSEGMCAWEKERYGVDHQRLGKEICVAWGLPDEITAVVSRHHKISKERDSIAGIVALVHLFMTSAKPEPDREEFTILQNARSAISTKVAEISRVLEVKR